MNSTIKILICEDDFLTLKALEHSIKNEGFEILLAKDGREAKEILTSENIHIFLTDIHVPYFSGLELIRFVREDLQKQIPILVLSRVGLEETILHAFELGATDYLTKPFNPADLMLRLKKLMLQL